MVTGLPISSIEFTIGGLEKSAHKTKMGRGLTKGALVPYDGFRSPQGRLQEFMRPMSTAEKTKAALTDSHFLVPLIAFCIGLALLIALH
jgi:hypothetical protein